MSPQNSRQALQNPHLTKSTFEMLNVGLLGPAKAEFSTHPPADGACLQPSPIPRCWDNPKKQLSGVKHPNPCDEKCCIQTLATDIPIPLLIYPHSRH